MIAQLKSNNPETQACATHKPSEDKDTAEQQRTVKSKTLTFHPLTISDRETVQAITLHAGRRNCNFAFANLVGWQFLYHTEVCVLDDVVILRFKFDDEQAYMVCTSGKLSKELVEALMRDSHGSLTIHGLEDVQVQQLEDDGWRMEREKLRSQYDYIYLRTDLAALHGGRLKAKRNHVNHFYAEYPDYEYRPLTPELFDECRCLTSVWQEEKKANETIMDERRAMEKVFAHWDELGMMGGALFIKEEEHDSENKSHTSNLRMVAFTYGTAVTTDTFDICVEKADLHVEGAFATINQQFAEHLPEQFIYINREEDMGIPGLRKAKLSYHPEILLSYNAVQLTNNHSEHKKDDMTKPYILQRMTAEDAPVTVDWMVRQYGFDRSEVESWVRNLHFNWPSSVKALDAEGKVIGLLNMSDYRIEEECPQILDDNPECLAQLNTRRYTAVFSFIVAESYRGTRLNYDMLMSIMPELKARYDFLFIPVLHRLETHHYWQRWGATEFYHDAECVCYKLELS